MSWPSLLKGVVLMTHEALALLLAFLHRVVSIIALLKYFSAQGLATEHGAFFNLGKKEKADGS